MGNTQSDSTTGKTILKVVAWVSGVATATATAIGIWIWAKPNPQPPLTKRDEFKPTLNNNKK